MINCREQFNPNSDFSTMVEALGELIVTYGEAVDTGHWQAMKDVPMTKTIELRAVNLTYEIPETAEELADEVRPSEPWAELQFQERVAGEPLNPGETFKQWPWYRGNVETHKEQGQFSHTYMERYWPRYIQPSDASYTGPDRQGIRYRYGDLNDLVTLLAREPYTRQAYLPVWFPEDTGAHHGERVPCSLGYHFMLREGKLHCAYFIRSCDFLRHFRDDVYMTARLVQWVLDKLRDTEVIIMNDQSNEVPEPKREWKQVEPGELTMFMHSLHVFEGDLPKMRREYGNA
jgi:thymidylate synthase